MQGYMTTNIVSIIPPSSGKISISDASNAFPGIGGNSLSNYYGLHQKLPTPAILSILENQRLSNAMMILQHRMLQMKLVCQ